MDDLLKALLPYVASAVIGIGAFIVKTVFDRLGVLEKAVNAKTDEAAVRQIVADKIDPIHEDLQEVKASLAKVIDLLIERK